MSCLRQLVYSQPPDGVLAAVAVYAAKAELVGRSSFSVLCSHSISVKLLVSHTTKTMQPMYAKSFTLAEQVFMNSWLPHRTCVGLVEQLIKVPTCET